MSLHTLYICYFGLKEPLVQTQVLPYLREIGQAGTRITLLTFEPREAEAFSSNEKDEWREKLMADGINWVTLIYHKKPSLPATLFDIVLGVIEAVRLNRSSRIDLIHARGYVPAMIGALTKKAIGAKMLFDIRGFMAEEYVDAGVWRSGGLLYKLTKSAENRLINSADGFVVLTKKAKGILFPNCADTDDRGRPIEVIPCCVDSQRFRAVKDLSKNEIRRELGLEARRVIVYAGALGGWYLDEEMAKFLAVVHAYDNSVFTLILTQTPASHFARLLKKHGVTEGNYRINKVAPSEIPYYLKAADIALSFIKACYSKQSSSPTKIAEYLLSGLPVISNSGIGDLDELILENRAGVIVKELNLEAYLQAFDTVLQLLREPDIAERCVNCALGHFDLSSIGGVRYNRIYQKLSLTPENKVAGSGLDFNVRL